MWFIGFLVSSQKVQNFHFGISLLIPILLFSLVQKSVNGYLRYSDQSCSDLVPRQVNEYKEPTDFSQYFGFEGYTGSRNRYRQVAKKKRSQYYETPYTIQVSGGNRGRYRRNSDLFVTILGEDFDGLMLQCRVVSGGTETISNGVGVIGQFRYLPYLFEYVPCFGLHFATVTDKGRPVKMANVTFTWTAPDSEAGDIRFIASVLKGPIYKIIASTVLTFNPFPISTYSCGSSMACFRVCSYGSYPCTARDALFIFSYNVDFRNKREIEFTMGGRIGNPKKQRYLAVAFGNDFKTLVQSDLTVCYLDGKKTDAGSKPAVKLDHLLIESLKISPYEHNEVIEVDDYDVDGRMLWCRFRRQLDQETIINPRTPLYHFYFWGDKGSYYEGFKMPPRNQIYTSAFKRNFSTPYNEIISGAFSHKKNTSHFAIIMFMTFHLLYFIKHTNNMM